MGLMQLISFIEERTRIRIPNEEVTRDNFETVASVERLVKRLEGKGA
jgi:acyl carrier protein